MNNSSEHYVKNGIHFYNGEPDVPSLVIHHHLSEEEAEAMSKAIVRMKQNAKRRQRYAEKKQALLHEKSKIKNTYKASNTNALQTA